MALDRYLKIVLTFIGLALWMILFKLWFSPQEALAENVDLESRLSYISKIVGTIESSVIKIESNSRFIKRQAEISKLTRNQSEQQFNKLQNKINGLESSINIIETDVGEMDSNITYIESDLDNLVSGSCNNMFLCRQKKS